MNLRSLLLLLPFIAFVSGYFVAHFICHDQSIHAPHVVGLTIEQALATISSKSLNIRVQEYVQDADLPSGTIIQQNPTAGQHMKAHQSLFVTLSQKPAALTAPDLIGKTTTSITKELEMNGIRITHVYLASQYPKDTCFAQYPGPGQHLKKNALLLYISRPKPKPMLWPSFIGKTYAQIRDFVDSHGITVDIRTAHTRATNSQQEIGAQYPAAGSIIMFDPHKPPILQILLK